MACRTLSNKTMKRLVSAMNSVPVQYLRYVRSLRPIFFIVGQPGVGKTTLITNVVHRLRYEHPTCKIQGFYTDEIRENTERIGYKVVSVDGKTSGILATMNPSGGSSGEPLVPMGKRYLIDVAGFESVALPELQIKKKSGLFVIDEVGKMELYSPNFFPAVKKIMDSNIPLLGAIPRPRIRNDGITEVDEIAMTPKLRFFDITEKNRMEAEEAVFSQLNRILDR